MIRRYLLLVPLVAATCTADTPDTTGGAVPPSHEPECIGFPAEVPPDYRIVLGQVALPASPEYSQALQLAKPVGDLPAFAKTGILVRPNSRALTLQVEGDGWIGWGDFATPERSFDFESCVSEADWIALPGGFWADQPVCMTIRAVIGERSEVVEVGVGLACPGQQPPVVIESSP